MRHIDEIIIHCAATKPEWMENQPMSQKVREIKRWHVQGRGWSDIGYHFLYDYDGTEGIGRAPERMGAHVAGHNATSIGICLIGGYGSQPTDDFFDHFTAAQDTALRAKLDALQLQFPSITKITGHNEYAAKGCPGFTVSEWLRAGVPVTPTEPPTVPVDPPAPFGPETFLSRLQAAILAFVAHFR